MWESVDLRGDEHELEYRGDPSELIDAAGLLEGLLHRPEWHARAACRGMGPSMFYTGQGQPLEPARDVCAGCSVRPECLSAALEVGYGDDNGVWAGTSRKQRRTLRHTAA